MRVLYCSVSCCLPCVFIFTGILKQMGNFPVNMIWKSGGHLRRAVFAPGDTPGTEVADIDLSGLQLDNPAVSAHGHIGKIPCYKFIKETAYGCTGKKKLGEFLPPGKTVHGIKKTVKPFQHHPVYPPGRVSMVERQGGCVTVVVCGMDEMLITEKLKDQVEVIRIRSDDHHIGDDRVVKQVYGSNVHSGCRGLQVWSDGSFKIIFRGLETQHDGHP